ncbi:MAG: hypothetical protein D6814_14165, partial [Calditrichaeota bacterium]
MIIIAGLLILFTLEVAPLWRDAKVQIQRNFNAAELGFSPGETPIAAMAEEYQQIGAALSTTGRIHFFELASGRGMGEFANTFMQDGEIVTAAWQPLDGGIFAFVTNRGRFFWADVHFNPHFVQDKREFQPDVDFHEPITLADGEAFIQSLTVAGTFD